MSELNQPDGERGIVMYGTAWCSDCHRARYLLDSYGISYEEIDVDHNETGLAIVRSINGGSRVVPTIIFPDGSVLVEPSNAELLARIDGDRADE